MSVTPLPANVPDPRPSSRPIRAAIVGAGLMGRWHAHALVRAGGKVVAVADTNVDSARRLAHAYRANGLDSLHALLQHDQVEVVHICTPLPTHASLAMQALEAGAHVLIEKPLAPDAVLTERLLAEAKGRSRLIVPVHQFLFQAGMRRALLRLPRLAPLVHLELNAMTAGDAGGDAASRDQLVADILPHALTLLQRCLPDGLDGIQWTVRQPTAGELRALGRSAQTSLAINISTYGRPTRNDLTIIGAHGSVHVDLFHGFAVFEDGKVSRTRKIMRPFRLAAGTLISASTNLMLRALHNEVAYPGLRALIEAFYRAIRRGTPAPISPQETLAVARVRDDLRVQLGRTVCSNPSVSAPSPWPGLG